MQLTLTTAHTADPVSLGEVRRWLNFYDGVTEDEDVLEALIDEAYEELEQRTNRKFCAQTWTVTLDWDEVGDEIRLPLVPLVSVSSIKTTDDDGTETTVGTSNYQVRAGENPRIVLTDTGEWPSDARDYDAMAITCVVGYNATKVPFAWFQPTSGTSPGLDDMTASLSDTWGGSAKTTYEIKLSTAATPDKFQWRTVTRDSDGQKTYSSWSAETAITGSAQTLSNNLQVTFAATTGHTADDEWRVQVYERLPHKVKQALKGLVLHWYTTKGRGVTETVSGQLISLPRHLEYLIDSMRKVPL